MDRNILTAEYVKSILSYDPETGIFRWKVDRGSKIKAGSIAGSVPGNPNPYVNIKIDWVLYKAHRLAWLIMRGYMPESIDHIDGDGANNRWCNLRECTMTQNKGNSRIYKNNTSGSKGVHYSPGRRKPWRVSVQRERKRKWLSFFTKEEADSAYLALAKELFGDFARAA